MINGVLRVFSRMNNYQVKVAKLQNDLFILSILKTAK
jgi:hypothetical protein